MNLQHFFIYLSFLLVFLGCKNSSDDFFINSVNGTLQSSKMGTTLIHEHILVDFIGADKTGYHRWDKEEVVNKMLPYLVEIKNYGVTLQEEVESTHSKKLMLD